MFPALQSAGERFYGFDARGAYWSDIGTPSEYRRASFDVVSGAFTIPATRARGVDPTASLGEGVCIEGPVWIGARARIGDSASIVGPSVLGDGVRIGERARIERSILWEGASVGSGAILHDTIVGKEYRVAEGELLNGALVANEAVPAV